MILLTFFLLCLSLILPSLETNQTVHIGATYILSAEFKTVSSSTFTLDLQIQPLNGSCTEILQMKLNFDASLITLVNHDSDFTNSSSFINTTLVPCDNDASIGSLCYYFDSETPQTLDVLSFRVLDIKKQEVMIQVTYVPMCENKHNEHHKTVSPILSYLVDSSSEIPTEAGTGSSEEQNSNNNIRNTIIIVVIIVVSVMLAVIGVVIVIVVVIKMTMRRKMVRKLNSITECSLVD